MEYTAKEIADHIGCDPRTVRNNADAMGTDIAYKVGKQWLFRKSAIEWMNERRSGRKVSLTIQIGKDLSAELTGIASRTGDSKSEIIRNLLNKALDEFGYDLD